MTCLGRVAKIWFVAHIMGCDTFDRTIHLISVSALDVRRPIMLLRSAFSSGEEYFPVGGKPNCQWIRSLSSLYSSSYGLAHWKGCEWVYPRLTLICWAERHYTLHTLLYAGPSFVRRETKGTGVAHTQGALFNPCLDHSLVCIHVYSCVYFYHNLCALVYICNLCEALGLTTHFFALAFITVVPFLLRHSFAIVWVRVLAFVTQLPRMMETKPDLHWPLARCNLPSSSSLHYGLRPMEVYFCQLFAPFYSRAALNP